MSKLIVNYLVGREIVNLIVFAAMIIGLLVMCLVAYAFVPAASDSSDTSDSHTVVSETNAANSAKTNYSVLTNTMYLNSAG